MPNIWVLQKHTYTRMHTHKIILLRAICSDKNYLHIWNVCIIQLTTGDWFTYSQVDLVNGRCFMSTEELVH